DRAFWAAVNQRKHVSAALIRRSVNRFRVVRIDNDVGDAGVLANLQNLVPGLAAISRFVESAIAARTPQRSLRRDVNDVRIFRIDRDAADVLRILETNIAPGLPPSSDL